MKNVLFCLLLSAMVLSCGKNDFETDDIANGELYLNFDFNGESISICQDVPWANYNAPCEMEANFFAYHSQLEHAVLDRSVLIEKVNYKKLGYTQDRFPPDLRILVDANGKSLQGTHRLDDGEVNYLEINDEAGGTYRSVDGEVRIFHVSKKTFIGNNGRDLREYRYVEGDFTATLRKDGTDFPISGQFLMSQFVGEM